MRMEDCTHKNLDRCVKLSYSVTTAEGQEAGGTGREKTGDRGSGTVEVNGEELWGGLW